jgi:hypothetical protein
MSHPNERAVAERLTSIISDAFNRSIRALERAGALDTKKLAKHYKGIGSKYYDLVTEQIELTVRSGVPGICELFTQDGGASGEGQKRAEPGASPNGGPAEGSGNSGVGGGPPSVS